jgi:hypothetical protein
MTPDETVDLLTVAAAFDQRTVGEGDAMAWYAVVGDLDFTEAKQAVIAHYSDSTERVMPAHVRIRVKAARRDRLARELVPAPPAELTDEPGRYKAELKASIREIADGFRLPKAVAALPASEMPPPAAEARKALGPALPPPERLLPPEEIARRQAAASRTARGAQVIAGTIEPDEDEGEPAA